jgi:uncharacterized alkaline shock family protein YloU
MTSRNRKEQGKQARGNFNLQPPPGDTLSLNGAGHEPDKPERAEQTDAAIGKIEVSPKAISHIASRAAQASYGVVGLASRQSRPGWAELLHREEEYKGVEVKFSGDQVVIDLYVVIEYGTRISEVARNIMSNTKFAVESALGVPVVRVNVNVQGIRVSQ